MAQPTKGGGGGRPAPAASPVARAQASPPPAPAVRAAAANPPAAIAAASQAARVANQAPSQSNIAKAVTATKVAARVATSPTVSNAIAQGQAKGATSSTVSTQVKQATSQRANAFSLPGFISQQSQAKAATSGTVSSGIAQGQAQGQARAATSATVSNAIAQGQVKSRINVDKDKPIRPSTVGVTNPNVGRVTTQTGRTTTGGGKTTTGGGKTTTGGGKTQSTSGLTPRQENEKLRQDLLNAQSQGNVTLVNQISKQLLQGNRNNQNIRDLITATKIDTRFTLSEQNRQKAEELFAQGKETEAESYMRAADAYKNAMTGMFLGKGQKIKNETLKKQVASRVEDQSQRVLDSWTKIILKPTPPVTEVIEDPVPEVQPFIFSPPPFIPAPPAQTLSPGRDVINFSSEMASPEALEQLYFELISGYELVNIARRDTIDGQSEAYTLISNLSSIRRDLDPSIIIYAQEPFRFTYDRYAIDLNDRIPGDQYLSNNNIDSFFYIDNNGDLVIELDNLKNDEEIELQIANSGKIT